MYATYCFSWVPIIALSSCDLQSYLNLNKIAKLQTNCVQYNILMFLSKNFVVENISYDIVLFLHLRTSKLANYYQTLAFMLRKETFLTE